MKLALNELFYSIQGEGSWVGTPMVFVRLAGCNLRCTWCDQPDTIANNYIDRDGNTYQLKSEKKDELDIQADLMQYPTKHVCLTGGEPTAHKLGPLVHRLIHMGKYLHMETNGTLAPEWAADISWICISPKRGYPINLEMGKWANEFKLIVDQEFEIHEAMEFTRYGKPVWLQPCNDKEKPNRDQFLKTIELVKDYPQFRLSTQLHKFIGVH